MAEEDQAETTFSYPSDVEFASSRLFDAPRNLVFEAWTDPKQLPNWMLGPEGWAMPICQLDLRPGGMWRIVWRNSGGSEMEIRGIYKEVLPPERLVSTESWGPEWPETINTTVFSEEKGKTRVTETILYPSKEARDAATQTGMKEGLAASLDRLDTLLQSNA